MYGNTGIYTTIVELDLVTVKIIDNGSGDGGVVLLMQEAL